MKNNIRCAWAKDSFNIEYHDNEWGVPVHDDTKLFEFLILEGAQAGLSWTTIIKKRQEYRKAFENFNPWKVSQYDAKKLTHLQVNEGIIRNKLKIAAAVKNAKAFLGIVKEFGSFDTYIWSFVKGKPIKNSFRKTSQIPAKTQESENMSRDLLQRGFTFVGPTICYAFMQAVGMVNDHQVDCFRYTQV